MHLFHVIDSTPDSLSLPLSLYSGALGEIGSYLRGFDPRTSMLHQIDSSSTHGCFFFFVLFKLLSDVFYSTIRVGRQVLTRSLGSHS